MNAILIQLLLVNLGWAPAAPVEPTEPQMPATFSLGRYVPADWWMYMHFAHSKDHEWIDEQWAEVWDALKQSGVDKDILSLILSLMDEANRAKTQEHFDKVKGLLAGVRWGDLIAREFVFAERIGPPFPDYLVMARGAEGSGEANANGLAAIMKHLVSFSESAKVLAEQRAGLDVWMLDCEKCRNIPVRPILFRKGDVIGFTIGMSTFDTVSQYMTGTASKPSILENPRFREAVRQVPKPEHGLMFFDFKLLVNDIPAFLDSVCRQKSKGETDEDDREFVRIFNKAVTQCDILDYSVITMETEGHQEIIHEYSRIQTDKLDRPLARMCRNRKPFEPFDKYIPADATGFGVDGFIDLELLYHTVKDFVGKEFSNGPELIAKWNEFVAKADFDLDRDFFSWWSGEMISVDMPACVVTPMGGADSVFMVRVKNAELASQKVNGLIDQLKTVVENHFKQPVMISPAPMGLEGFREINVAPLAMFLRPVVGVRDEWLMIGTSAQAVTKCLEVSTGKAPSIMKNERFLKEGLVPKGPVASASFTDTSNFGQELGAALGMASMIGGMMGAMIPTPPDDPQAKKGKEFVTKIFGVLMKLGPVASKIDFYSSESSITTTEGPITRSKTVVTYKPSAAQEKKAAATPRAE